MTLNRPALRVPSHFQMELVTSEVTGPTIWGLSDSHSPKRSCAALYLDGESSRRRRVRCDRFTPGAVTTRRLLLPGESISPPCGPARPLSRCRVAWKPALWGTTPSRSLRQTGTEVAGARGLQPGRRCGQVASAGPLSQACGKALVDAGSGWRLSVADALAQLEAATTPSDRMRSSGYGLPSAAIRPCRRRCSCWYAPRSHGPPRLPGRGSHELPPGRRLVAGTVPRETPRWRLADWGRDM